MLGASDEEVSTLGRKISLLCLYLYLHILGSNKNSTSIGVRSSYYVHLS